MFQLLYNNAAGEVWVKEWADGAEVPRSDGYFREIAICETKEELEREKESLAGDTVYCVFENRPAGEAFISQENRISGNWRGSKYGYFSLAGEYPELEDAEKHLRSLPF